MARRGGSGPVRLRLAVAFVAVALSAVAMLAGLTAAFAAADVSHLADEQRSQLAQAMTAAAGAAWDRGNSWAHADLGPVLDADRRVGADVEISGNDGQMIAASPGFSRDTGPVQRAAVVVRGRQVGRIAVRLTGTGLAAADAVLRTALWRAIAGAAGLTALLAVLAGLAASRRITEPLGRLIEVARAIGHGDRAARVGTIRAPDEIRDFAATFDRMADSLDRQDRLRRDVVADVAHELRTPVAILQAGHEALLDGVVDPTPGQLTSLRDEVLRLARLVDDLHTLAAAEAAALQLTLTRCDLAEIAATAADRLASRFDAGGVALERQLTPVIIAADADRVHQVIANLLGNALKFTPAGGRVRLQAGPAGGQARLAVADTGTGIPADELPRIFDRFWRGRQATWVAGSGIGLAVVRELVRGHGGEVEAVSIPAQGTQVIVTLPGADCLIPAAAKVIAGNFQHSLAVKARSVTAMNGAHRHLLQGSQARRVVGPVGPRQLVEQRLPVDDYVTREKSPAALIPQADASWRVAGSMHHLKGPVAEADAVTVRQAPGEDSRPGPKWRELEVISGQCADEQIRNWLARRGELIEQGRRVAGSGESHVVGGLLDHVGIVAVGGPVGKVGQAAEVIEVSMCRDCDHRLVQQAAKLIGQAPYPQAAVHEQVPRAAPDEPGIRPHVRVNVRLRYPVGVIVSLAHVEPARRYRQPRCHVLGQCCSSPRQVTVRAQ